MVKRFTPYIYSILKRAAVEERTERIRICGDIPAIAICNSESSLLRGTNLNITIITK